MNLVFEETKKTLLHDEDAVVCSIVDVQGSAPRKTGASMLVTEGGKTYGTIGGGELEMFCTKNAKYVFSDRKTRVLELGLDKDLGMICGGNVTVEFKFIPKETKVDDLYNILGVQRSNSKVVVFGAGHVGRELVPVLEHLDFNVVLLDDRENVEADYILCEYSNISEFVKINKDDYVVIMTHGHIADREVLLQVCRISPKYIGCIGSRKKVEATAAFLRENGISEETIKNIHSPIGLPIGGDTPQEIAISVAAQLIQIRSEENNA